MYKCTSKCGLFHVDSFILNLATVVDLIMALSLHSYYFLSLPSLVLSMHSRRSSQVLCSQFQELIARNSERVRTAYVKATWFYRKGLIGKASVLEQVLIV